MLQYFSLRKTDQKIKEVNEMKSFNSVTIVGRSVRDTDLKEVGESARAFMTFAVDRPYKDSDGKHPTDFLNVIAWGKLAEICGDYIKKGSLVLISGRVQSRSYDVEQETKWITEIVAEGVNVLEYKTEDSKVLKKKAA